VRGKLLGGGGGKGRRGKKRKVLYKKPLCSKKNLRRQRATRNHGDILQRRADNTNEKIEKESLKQEGQKRRKKENFKREGKRHTKRKLVFVVGNESYCNT